MIIEINIDIKKNKHDYEGIAKTSLAIDSDQVDPLAVTNICNGLIESALARAFAKRAESVPKIPTPLPPSIEESNNF